MKKVSEIALASLIGLFVVALLAGRNGSSVPPSGTPPQQEIGKSPASTPTRRSSAQGVAVAAPVGQSASPRTATPQPRLERPSAAEHVSRNYGLGDTKRSMDLALGPPSTDHTQQTASGLYGPASYKDDNVGVNFLNGRVEDIEVACRTDLAGAKRLAKELMPTDAVHTGKDYWTAAGEARQFIAVYKSNIIKKLWKPVMFRNSEGVEQPGTFIVMYTFDTLNHPEEVMTVSVAIGNNP